jgi:O-antigen/teichoic acid export membrane protein
MGLVRAQAFNNLVISYLGIAIGYVNITILFPRLLAQEVFGLTQVLLAAMLFASNLGSFGLQFIIIRFFHIFRAKEISERKFFSTSLLIAIAGIIVTSLCLLIFGPQVKALYIKKAALFPDYYYLMFPLVIFGILSILLDAYSRSILKSVLTAIYKEVVLRIMQLIVVVLFYFDCYDLEMFLIIFTGLQGVYVVLMYISILRYSDAKPALDFSGIDKPLFKDILKFGGVSMFSITALLANNLDVLIVGAMVGLNASAVFSVAASVARMINVPSRAMNRVAFSLVAEAWAFNDLKKINSLYTKSAITSLIIGGIIFLLIVINLPILISFLPPSYAEAEVIVLSIAFAKLIQMATGINAGIIAASKDHWMNMASNTLSFISLLILSYFFINLFGMIGAAYAAIVVEALANFSRFIWLKSKYNMQPFDNKYLKVLALGTSIYLLNSFLPNATNLIVDCALRTLIFVPIFIGFVHVKRYSNDISDTIDLVIKKISKVFN